jgi:serine/threonine protein phosphatase PrpC
MEKNISYLRQIFTEHSIIIEGKNKSLFTEFCNQTINQSEVNKIFEVQAMVIKNWQIFTRIADIQKQSFLIPNASVGKYYEHQLDFEKLQIQDLAELRFTGLEEIGLGYNPETKVISGIPKTSGDIKIHANFLLKEQIDVNKYNEKNIVLIINPDPKSLWKNLPSSRGDKFWKEDNVELSGSFIEKKIVISSKRGRSHANNGSGRDDHFAYKNYENGWSIVALSDGAGSATYSREGSKIACEFIVEYFSTQTNNSEFLVFDGLIQEYHDAQKPEITQQINHFIYNELGKGALQTHKKLESDAASLGMSSKDLNSTLIFSLVKKYAVGYVILSFSVGDCPIALLNKDLSKVDLLNKLDVGDYGGGTRFITMPEIFDPVTLQKRFSFRVVDDFSYLMLMTDGVYDPKFITEANLENIDKWNEFLFDLKGANSDEAVLDFDYNNENVATELSKWLDFWDSGNHDDRTLAIIF